MKLLLPIAGSGSRFKKEIETNSEFLKPKPLISVRGYPMVRWATGSLPFVAHKGNYHPQARTIIESQDIIFVALQKHEQEYGITARLKELYGDGLQVVLIPKVTRGAAETALCAKDFINRDEPLIVSDSDHYFDGQAIFDGLKAHPAIDGMIPVFQVPEGDTKWSFSHINEQGYIDKVAEKKPISRWANIGAYYFGKGIDFLAAASETVEKGEYTNNEFYIAPLYNKLIAQGKKITPVFPKYVHGLGTPADLSCFLEHTTYTLD